MSMEDQDRDRLIKENLDVASAAIKRKLRDPASMTAAALTPLFAARDVGHIANVQVREWPREFRGHPLIRVPLNHDEQQFLDDFPGAVARFSDGQHDIIMRSRLAYLLLLLPFWQTPAFGQCAPAPDSPYFFRNLAEQRAEARLTEDRAFLYLRKTGAGNSHKHPAYEGVRHP